MGKILVTGGTGFIGSHACVSLINAGYSVVVVDNLCNSKVEALARIQLITGKQVRFYQADLRDEESIRQIFIDNKIDVCIRNKIPLIVYNNEVVWISGMCLNENYKVTSHTENILKFEIK